MMPWIQVRTELSEHPKIYRLREELKLKKNYEAVGLVVCLWLWAANHAPDGVLSAFPAEAIEKASGYYNGKRLIAALKKAGWVDETQDGKVKLHDWEEHAAGIIDMIERQKKQNRERVKRCRRKKREENPAECHGEGNVTGMADRNAAVMECNGVRGQDRTEQEKREDEMERTRSTTTGEYGEGSSWWSSLSSCDEEELVEWVGGQLEGLSPAGRQELREAMGEYGAKKCMEAVCIAMDQGRPVWRYVRGILKNWRAEGQYSFASARESAAGEAAGCGQAGDGQRQLRAFLQSLKEEPEPDGALSP